MSEMRETPQERWRRRAIKAAIHLSFALVVYAGLVFAARALHRRVLYQPPESEAPQSVPEGATLITAAAADGAPVYALHFALPKATRTIVHFHGNAETADENVTLARMFQKRGFEFVLVEYRGYGRARPGKPTEEGLYADAVAVLDALGARGIGADRIVLWGQSLGTGVATEMARRGRGARLVLVAPFTSTTALAQRAVPIIPASWIMVDKFDSLAKAPSVKVPALVVHGDIDDVIPMELGERLSRALPQGEFYKVAEGRHDNLYKNLMVIARLTTHVGG